MKNYLVWLLCAFTLAFTSCEFSENIYINEDGSGTMEFKFDGSALMELAGDEIAKEGTEKMDTTISFKELIEEEKDSIATLSKEEQEALKALENFNLHMVMDSEKSEMRFDLNTEFKDVSELTDVMKAMNNAAKYADHQEGEEEMTNPMDAFTNGRLSEMRYSFKNNVFRRAASITDNEAYAMALEDLGDMESMAASSKYTLNYHFPKKIKSVSNENALFSADRKSFTLTYDFMDYVKDPESMNLEVILED